MPRAAFSMLITFYARLFLTIVYWFCREWVYFDVRVASLISRVSAGSRHHVQEENSRSPDVRAFCSHLVVVDVLSVLLRALRSVYADGEERS